MKQSMEKEALRQVYLREMGIQVWYPRFKLPHTDIVREYDWVASSNTPQAANTPHAAKAPQIAAVKPPHATAEPTPQTAIAPQAPDLADSAAYTMESVHVKPMVQSRDPELDDLSPQAPRPVAEQPASEADSEDALQFAFAWLAVSDSLAVICEIPYHTRGRLQTPVRSLLARILDALSVPVRPGSTPVIHFHWPLYDAQPQPTHSNLPENELLNQGLESARQTLHAFMARQFTERPAPYLLIFSEQWPQYLFPADFAPADTQGIFMHPQFATQVLLTRGLHVMLADDSVKKPVWQQLQLLKAQIKQWNSARPLEGEV